jgi:LPS sulfotransferase NodH
MRFVIIASPRTGSSNLANVLGGHPDILCNGNIFHPRNAWVFWPGISKRERKDLFTERNADPRAFLEKVFTTGFGRAHVGFKIFEGQHDEILGELIDEPSIRKIVLYRQNVLANYSSALVARATGKYSLRADQKAAAPPLVHFDANKFFEFMGEYNAFYRTALERLNARAQAVHYINYEDTGDPLLLGALVSFIGADPAGFNSNAKAHKRQVKQNSSDIVARFSNPETVREFLTENGLMNWAHEGWTRLSQNAPEAAEAG